jgi:purine-binding chemotaxis protein CheW
MERENNQFLLFSLGRETFGIVIGQVREIIEYPGLTAMPLMPAFIVGVINVRSAVVPVIDLSVRFGRASTVINRRSCIVVVESPSDTQRRPLGIMVDGVTEVLSATPEKIGPRPDFGNGLRAAFIECVLKRERGFAMILDLANVLSFAEMEQFDITPLASVANG